MAFEAPWDAKVPDLETCVRRYEAGPDANTRMMLDELEPLDGKRVLDLAGGFGLTSAFLAARGAVVTSLEINPTSVERARQLARRLAFSLEPICGRLTPRTFPPRCFDAVAGSYALRDVDVEALAPMLGDVLVREGRAAFLETLAADAHLELVRARWPRVRVAVRSRSGPGQPLTSADLGALAREIGELQLGVSQMSLLRSLDRDMLGHRAHVSALLGTLDDRLHARGLGQLSRDQVIVATKPGARGTQRALIPE